MRFAAVAIFAAFTAFSTVPASAAPPGPQATCKELRSAHSKAKATPGAMMDRRRAARRLREKGCR